MIASKRSLAALGITAYWPDTTFTQGFTIIDIQRNAYNIYNFDLERAGDSIGLKIIQ